MVLKAKRKLGEEEKKKKRKRNSIYIKYNMLITCSTEEVVIQCLSTHLSFHKSLRISTLHTDEHQRLMKPLGLINQTETEDL